MQLIFFVPPNEELEGTLHPQMKKPVGMLVIRSHYHKVSTNFQYLKKTGLVTFEMPVNLIFMSFIYISARNLSFEG